MTNLSAKEHFRGWSFFQKRNQEKDVDAFKGAKDKESDVNFSKINARLSPCAYGTLTPRW